VQSHGHGRKEEGEEQCRCQISDCRLQIVDWGRMRPKCRVRTDV
jgi:hypothetical protein